MEQPTFAEWLADTNAQPLTIADSGSMLDWIGQSYGEQGVNKMLDAIIDFHGEAGVSMTLHVEKNESLADPWLITDAWGRGSGMTELHVYIQFKSTDAYL